METRSCLNLANRKSHIKTIDNSLENIKTAAMSIVIAAAEDRKRDSADLENQLAVKDRVIKDSHRDIDNLNSEIAETKKQLAETESALIKATDELANSKKLFIEQADDYKARIKDQMIRIEEQAELIKRQREQIDNLISNNEAHDKVHNGGVPNSV